MNLPNGKPKPMPPRPISSLNPNVAKALAAALRAAGKADNDLSAEVAAAKLETQAAIGKAKKK